jgi:hypothetical protein
MVTVVKSNNRNALSLKVVASGGSITPSTQAGAVTVTSAAGVTAAVTRLDSLVDVVESNPQNNSTLVYYSANDTYVVEQLNLDGGSF